MDLGGTTWRSGTRSGKVPMGGDNASTIQRVLNCEGAQDDVRAGYRMRILGALKARGEGCSRRLDYLL